MEQPKLSNSNDENLTNDYSDAALYEISDSMRRDSNQQIGERLRSYLRDNSFIKQAMNSYKRSCLANLQSNSSLRM